MGKTVHLPAGLRWRDSAAPAACCRDGGPGTGTHRTDGRDREAPRPQGIALQMRAAGIWVLLLMAALTTRIQNSSRRENGHTLCHTLENHTKRRHPG